MPLCHYDVTTLHEMLGFRYKSASNPMSIQSASFHDLIQCISFSLSLHTIYDKIAHLNTFAPCFRRNSSDSRSRTDSCIMSWIWAMQGVPKERLVTCACAVNSPFCLHATGPPKPEARCCMQPKLFKWFQTYFNVFGMKSPTVSDTKSLSGPWDDPRMHEDLMPWVVTHEDMTSKILPEKQQTGAEDQNFCAALKQEPHPKPQILDSLTLKNKHPDHVHDLCKRSSIFTKSTRLAACSHHGFSFRLPIALPAARHSWPYDTKWLQIKPGDKQSNKTKRTYLSWK